MKSRTVGLVSTLACGVVAGCAGVPETHFAAHYVGSVHDAHMDLDVLTVLPERGATGWLINVAQSEADARFSAGRGGPPKYRVTPVFVKFSAERSVEHPAARYRWEGDAFIVCMVFVQFASAPDTGKMVLVYDYDLCAPMRAAAR